MMKDIARAARRTSEQFIGSVFKLEDLAECILLSDLDGLMVELDDPSGEINFGILEIPVTVSYRNGCPFMRGRYTHRNHTVNLYGAGDDEENILFSLTLSGHPRFKHPAASLAGPLAVEKKLSAPQQHEIAKLKHKTGLTVFRINKDAPLIPSRLARDAASDLQVVKANQSTPYLDIRREKTCCSVLLNWCGLTYHNSRFSCYKADHLIGTVSPKISCGYTRYAYVIDFYQVPAPSHVPKTIILASAIAMLLNLGPINVNDEIVEEP